MLNGRLIIREEENFIRLINCIVTTKEFHGTLALDNVSFQIFSCILCEPRH